jgi:hypothetical protein
MDHYFGSVIIKPSEHLNSESRKWRVTPRIQNWKDERILDRHARRIRLVPGDQRSGGYYSGITQYNLLQWCQNSARPHCFSRIWHWSWWRTLAPFLKFVSGEKKNVFLNSSHKYIWCVDIINGVLFYFGSYLSHLFSRITIISGFSLYWPNPPFCTFWRAISSKIDYIFHNFTYLLNGGFQNWLLLVPLLRTLQLCQFLVIVCHFGFLEKFQLRGLNSIYSCVISC